MSRKADLLKLDIPDLVTDPGTKRQYRKGKFLGRGGFAKCFELTDVQSNRLFAGKVIAKSQLQKPEQKEKMSQEIAIHKSIKHKHVVEFHNFFEDKDYIYIILEICNKRSLMEMHKRRKTLTEPEVRYLVYQIALACKYLHDNRIVHRDLKLGNLFLNDSMEIKVGDFGLATRVSTGGERKMTLCGTPNYIAPEVLTKKGHSFEVDVWSLGCIVYTLLVGRPPFETNDLKDTYRKIRHNDYSIPSAVGPEARVFIEKLLQADPLKRPTMDAILHDPYMTRGYTPSRIPASCLTTAPRFDQGRLSIMPTDVCSPRRPLGEVNQQQVMPAPQNAIIKREVNNHAVKSVPKLKAIPFFPRPDYHLTELKAQLRKVVAETENLKVDIMGDEAQEPAASPVFWISKWVDYTDKYGIGYQLCDNSIGVLFNDLTRIVLMSDEQTIQYIDKEGSEQFLPYGHHEDMPHLFKKITLLRYFKNYMNEHLLKTGEKQKDCDDISRLPYLNNWFRTKNAIAFQLTNGTVQINFFNDHTKLILCPHMGAVTYITDKREFATYKFNLISQNGCSRDLSTRLRYALEVVDKLSTTRVAKK